MNIVPHLWYAQQAKEAAEWYCTLIDNSKLNWVHTMTNTPSGDAELVAFNLANMSFVAISTNHTVGLNESSSLMLRCSDKEEVYRLYNALIEGGRELMPLDTYDFSERDVWLADKYGLNWQTMFDKHCPSKHHFDLYLLFDLEQSGNALPALSYYQSVFQLPPPQHITYYDGSQPDPKAQISYAELPLPKFNLVAMDHGYGGNVTFNEAFSLMIYCDTDEELNHYWEKLSHYPDAEQCGWVKDQFGISWQIVPRKLMQLYDTADPKSLANISRELLWTKKITVQAVEKLLT